MKDIIAKAVAGFNLELVEIEFTESKTIRVFVDKQGGLLVHDCEILSDYLNRVLQVEEIDYNRLEVSSPGLDRPLNTISDYSRFIGKDVKIKLKSTLDEQKYLLGTILAVSIDTNIIELALKLDDALTTLNKKNKIIKQKHQQQISTETILINFDTISKARLTFDYRNDLRASKARHKNKPSDIDE